MLPGYTSSGGLIMKARSQSAANLDVVALTAPMQKLHDSCDNCSYDWRVDKLTKLRQMLLNHWEEWAFVLKQDLGKCRVESVAMELLMVRTELDYTLKHLEEWMKAEPIPSPGVCIPAFSRLEKRPLTGPAVLVIGPSNYPVSLVLHPAMGALAAGNSVVVKPSELTPNVEALCAKLIPQYFNEDTLACVTGGIPETTALLEQPWGSIFFTGSAQVGKIVAKAAAETLTPVTLELGGKSPAYIDGVTCPFDIDQVVHRILWSKTVNAGQTCAATDTLVVDEKLLGKLIPAMKKSIIKQYGENPKGSELGRIVSPKHAKRLVELIQEVEQVDNKTTKVLLGGSKACDAAACYVAPTIVLNPPSVSRVMQEEIFGPILPVVAVKSREKAIEFMKNMPGTPLCLYVFTSSESVFEEVSQRVPAGSAMRNDCLVHLSSPFIPFGGLGTSGFGGYHGKYSFDTFSHTQPIMYRPCFPGFDFNMLRFHPFGKLKVFLMTDVLLAVPAIPVMHVGFFRSVLKGLVMAWLFSLLWIHAPLELNHFKYSTLVMLRQPIRGIADAMEKSAASLRLFVE